MAKVTDTPDSGTPLVPTTWAVRTAAVCPSAGTLWGDALSTTWDTAGDCMKARGENCSSKNADIASEFKLLFPN